MKLTRIEATGIDSDVAHTIEEICRTYQLAGIMVDPVDLAACVMRTHIPKGRWLFRFKWWLWRFWQIYVSGKSWLKI